MEEISAQFNSLWLQLSKKTPFREVELFRSLSQSIISTSGQANVEEFHGSKHQVAFAGRGSWSRKIARCELADLFIIIFSKRPTPFVRMTFLQAKKSSNVYNLCHEYPEHMTSTNFQANLEQWDLLSRRPMLIGLPPFEPPTNLLNGAILPSVGSFCVFYIKNDGTKSFFYISADSLKPSGNPTNRYASLSTIVGHQDRKIGVFDEKRIACCPEIFGFALFNGMIGTPIHFGNYSNSRDDDYRSTARKWLSRTLRANLAQTENEYPLTRQLVSFLEVSEDVDYDRSSYPLPSKTLIISTDNLFEVKKLKY